MNFGFQEVCQKPMWQTFFRVAQCGLNSTICGPCWAQTHIPNSYLIKTSFINIMNQIYCFVIQGLFLNYCTYVNQEYKIIFNIDGTQQLSFINDLLSNILFFIFFMLLFDNIVVEKLYLSYRQPIMKNIQTLFTLSEELNIFNLKANNL